MQTQHGGADTTLFSVAGRKRTRSDSSDDPRPRAWRRAFKHLLLEHAADVGSVNNNILLAAACAVIRLKLSVDYGVQNMGSILQSEHCNTVAMVLEEIRQESSKATRYACLCNLRHRCSLPAPADSIYRADTYAGSTMRTSLSCWKGNLCRAHAEITCRARRSAPGQVGAEGLAAAERVLLVREDLEVAIGQAMMANAANCSACGALHEQQR